MNVVVEPSRKVPVVAEADVVVAGGGPGGVAAAVAAAREGANVLLIERYGFLGGLATAGLIGPFLGYAAYEENAPILGGIPVEIIDRLRSLDGIFTGDKFKWYYIDFDPEALKLLLDEMVTEAGVTVLLHSYIAGVTTNEKGIDAIIVENKSGRQAIRANYVIDATGDGDVANYANLAFTKGRKADGITQSMGTKFILAGVKDMSTEEKEQAKEITRNAIAEGKINAFHPGIMESGVTMKEGLISPTVTRAVGDGTNVEDLTRAEIKIRKDTWEIVTFWNENIPAYKDAYLVATPAQVGVRETRQIIGDYVLTGQDVLDAKDFEDGIARGSWFMDIHCPLGRIGPETFVCSKDCKMEPPCVMKEKYPDQLLPELWPSGRGWYKIPYRSLTPKGVDNLLISGRCISADHHAMSSLRVMGTCLAIGEAAGVAAALAAKNSDSVRDVDVKEMQTILKKNGAQI